MVHLWGELRALESEHGVDFLREPDLGFAAAAWQWASGHRLDSVLLDADMSAGDFVRAVRQLIDLLDQVAVAATVADTDTPLRDTARHALGALDRGVVAYARL